MKNDVLALGNALVDHEYQVTDEVLASTKLDKGSAALADQAQQQALISELATHNAPLVKKAGGGSAANTVFTIAALGGKSSISCTVCDDEAGHFYLQNLTEAGVKTSVQSLAATAEPTGSCMVLVTPDAERTMQSFLGASAHFGFEAVDESLLNTAEMLYIEGYLAASEQAVDAVVQAKEIAKAQNTKVALSFSDPSMVNFCKQGLLTMLGEGVDILFCNQEEATLFTEKSGIEATAQALQAYADLVVITLGSQGAFVSKKGEAAFTVPTAAVETVLDTNGAGDNFAGAFLYGLSQSYALEDCAKLAVAVAGKLIGHFGPRMQTEDYQQLLSEFQGIRA